MLLQPLSYDHRCIRGAILEEELVPYPLIFIAKPLTHRSFIGFLFLLSSLSRMRGMTAKDVFNSPL